MGDFLRNDMFDKYFMKIGAQDKTPATGYDSAHYLMAGILHGVVELVHPGHGRSDEKQISICTCLSHGRSEVQQLPYIYTEKETTFLRHQSKF